MKDFLPKVELPHADCAIGYKPLSTEPDYTSVLSHVPLVMLPQDPNVNPFVLAAQLAQEYEGKSVMVLIPGTRFDRTGTRYGRGGGWFDRFLSRVPREWLRVGVLFEAQLSPAPLVRGPHDEAVDTLLVFGESSIVSVYVIR